MFLISSTTPLPIVVLIFFEVEEPWAPWVGVVALALEVWGMTHLAAASLSFPTKWEDWIPWSVSSLQAQNFMILICHHRHQDSPAI